MIQVIDMFLKGCKVIPHSGFQMLCHRCYFTYTKSSNPNTTSFLMCSGNIPIVNIVVNIGLATR